MMTNLILVLNLSVDPEKMIEDHLRTGQQIVETQIQKQEEEDEELVRFILYEPINIPL